LHNVCNLRCLWNIWRNGAIGAAESRLIHKKGFNMTIIGKASFRGLLGLSVCVPALMVPAFAQSSDDSGGAQEIIVTGSRIPTIRDEGPSPVTAITSDTIRANG
jgi:hypothetical protein